VRFICSRATSPIAHWGRPTSTSSEGSILSTVWRSGLNAWGTRSISNCGQLRRREYFSGRPQHWRGPLYSTENP
jgi:hypothetical protein